MKILLSHQNITKIFLISFCIFHLTKADWLNTTNSPSTIPVNSYIEMRDYILNIASIHEHYGEIRSFVDINSDEGQFDIFMLNDINDMKCYKVMIESQAFDQTCNFLNDPKKVLLKQTKYQLDSSYSNFTQTKSQYAYFVIDNTPFPTNGAQPQGSLKIQTHYAAYIESTKKYVTLVLTFGILLAGLVVFSIACVLFCLYRYKRVQADYISYKSYSQEKRNNNRSFVSSVSNSESMLRKTPFSSQIETSKTKFA